MTMQDRDRLKVLHEVTKKHLTQKEAAEQLGLSRRWVKKLMKRMRREGDRGVMHRLRGKVSNRKIALKVQQEAVKIVRATVILDRRWRPNIWGSSTTSRWGRRRYGSG